jgi:hypothetical protein
MKGQPEPESHYTDLQGFAKGILFHSFCINSSFPVSAGRVYYPKTIIYCVPHQGSKLRMIRNVAKNQGAILDCGCLPEVDGDGEPF